MRPPRLQRDHRDYNKTTKIRVRPSRIQWDHRDYSKTPKIRVRPSRIQWDHRDYSETTKITLVDPEVGTLGVLDIQCRPNAPTKKKKKKKKKNDQKFFMGSHLTCLFSLLACFTQYYMYVHMRICQAMMGYAKLWWGIGGIGWLAATPRKKREMLLSTLPHNSLPILEGTPPAPHPYFTKMAKSPYSKGVSL